MPAWKGNLKNGESFVFKPITYEGEEVFSLWDRKNKRFIKSGEQIITSKGIQEVNTYIFLTPKEKQRYTRNLKVRRVIDVDGKEYFFDVGVRTEQRIRELFQQIENQGDNPLDYKFKITRQGDGLQTKYIVDIVGKDEKSREIIIPAIRPKEEFKLTEFEQEVVNAIKERANDRTKEEKFEILLINKIEKERAKKIVDLYF